MWTIVIILALLIPLIAVVLDSQLGRAIAARLERDASAIDGGLAGRVAALEGEVERLSREVQRLDEESEFTQRLLQERSSRPALPSTPPE